MPEGRRLNSGQSQRTKEIPRESFASAGDFDWLPIMGLLLLDRAAPRGGARLILCVPNVKRYPLAGHEFPTRIAV